mmetsp:Transcript_29647/g.40948  ORF Transcript_29647/g.40948 Transcript_29647/m.40948 type:complete len:133 (+) Transcript_29647:64-462(+)|eukprot:CAMPEP_0201488460 /NCGR_PEP_ID=MMETSP0151_2-20130828/18348_1 /ASSEMBLY_ACC=CAM_ASM_000257 /TAXON_ID=200890 /ORGANISM="Paramoeba atlantica, Strain 621/1 / CCAP 1560/9" /LENGTH=132 /DNA_ID=CAMNT_0047873753 /DNA_START=35 /DNA_END=433 /DNA_ORIENTATION=-
MAVSEAQVVMGWFSLLLGILFEVLGFPLWTRWIERDGLYGVKTEQTLADDLTWYKVNEMAGKILFYEGFASIVVSLFFFLVGAFPLALEIIVFLVCLIGGPAFLFYSVKKNLKSIEDFGTVAATGDDVFRDL